MENGQVVSPDAASISGIAAFIEPTEGGEMVRVPGNRKPVSTKPPPGPRSDGKPSLIDRLKSRLSANNTPATDEDEASATTDSAPEENKTPPGQRAARCFECGQVQHVSAAARSTQCGRCTRYISLEDYEITNSWSHNIYTRGDIVVGRQGHLVGTEVACHHLTVVGELSATVDCSGDATFRGPARILGQMPCQHLRVEKKSKATFPQGVAAQSADIYGQLDGDLLCSGTVTVHKAGSILGDVVAKSIEIKEGGLVTGRHREKKRIELPPYPKKTHRFDTDD